MWQTVDYKGNTVKWYEAELIEKIKAICEVNMLCEGGCPYLQDILDLIQENEK